MAAPGSALFEYQMFGSVELRGAALFEYQMFGWGKVPWLELEALGAGGVCCCARALTAANSDAAAQNVAIDVVRVPLAMREKRAKTVPRSYKTRRSELPQPAVLFIVRREHGT